ncbi:MULTISPECIES: hypothetical protein [Plantibacter]|uniref:hypothetical protein n=1 Tax=Plantibacter TaxID=190323 RepID=UPI0010C211BF|nr:MULTISPECIES: hypothetical protein [Plantibacter]MBD8103760.1 hypothetical protein [Plantibacter sp. CFBP 8775]MBD8467209.1 hypothetical protein [Plantibacter sp. CFBP 8798]MBD8516388.1 hypothetical protein [Plantibacter sp. CFBP 8804]
MEPDAIVWNSTLPDELYGAIGRVAHASALLDAMLSELAEHLTGNVETWVFVAGQSTEWLIQMCRVLLDETADPQKDRYSADFHEALRGYLGRASELRNARNRVIHGTWSKARYAEKPLPRLWGDSNVGRIFWVSRDRQRRSLEDQPMTVQDVHRLADEISLVTAGVIQAWRAVTPHEPEWPPFRRWRDLGFDSDEE